MRTRTVTVREGELLGPVDWTYDFASHGWDRGGACNPETVAESIEVLRKIEAEPSRWKVWTHSEPFSDRYGRVISVGMYDGWPYWRPVPSVFLTTAAGGGEWSSFFGLKIREVTA